jgi:hypothetical protein
VRHRMDRTHILSGRLRIAPSSRAAITTRFKYYYKDLDHVIFPSSRDVLGADGRNAPCEPLDCEGRGHSCDGSSFHAGQPNRNSKETVDQRIAQLHASLAITPSEEADWVSVTKAMGVHASVMERLIADKSNADPSKLSAVEDLQVYERFARAHVEGFKTLTASFETLYKSMPVAQKKVADQVFQNFGHEAAAAHG